MNIEKLQTITICPSSALFPTEWFPWIFDSLSTDAPFSWGDTEHTLVSADSFQDWLKEVFSRDSEDNEHLANKINEHKDSIFNTLRKLEDLGILIDLEA